MAQRNVIEETCRIIAPSRRRAIPNPPPIAAGFDSAAGALNASLPPAAVQASASAPRMTVNINATGSQALLGRSNDIARAGRLAMMNLHPINEVVAAL